MSFIIYPLLISSGYFYIKVVGMDISLLMKAKWNLDYKKTRDDLLICGSPQTTDYRIVVQSAEDKFYLLERVKKSDLKRKEIIANALEALNKSGLDSVNLYIKSEGNNIAEFAGEYWQISNYIQSTDLKRPDYAFEARRGTASALFLKQFRLAAQELPKENVANYINFKDFFFSFVAKLEFNSADVYEKVADVISMLKEKLWPEFDNIPLNFAHGDFHPLNILWNEICIKAVVDWEFLAVQPENYDVANMLGCLGMEDPESLGAGYAFELVSELKEDYFENDLSLKLLPVMIISLRFAWLSDWLKHDDKEMIDLECVYINILADNYSFLEELCS